MTAFSVRMCNMMPTLVQRVSCATAGGRSVFVELRGLATSALSGTGVLCQRAPTKYIGRHNGGREVLACRPTCCQGPRTKVSHLAKTISSSWYSSSSRKKKQKECDHAFPPPYLPICPI